MTLTISPVYRGFKPDSHDHLEFVDRPWPKDPRLRQIVVRATNPKGQTIQVSLLTDDLIRPAMEILRLMFNRWIQENDFKYNGILSPGF